MYLGEQNLQVQEIPEPDGAFLVRVHGCDICGTDLKTWLHGHPNFRPPCILGHEFIGTVERAPEESGFLAGDAVVVAPYGECGECALCQRGAGELCRHKRSVSSGAFCELGSVPDDFVKDGVIRLDTLDDAYTLVEPLSCVLTAMEKMHITPKSNVLIAGGGPMGMLFALMLTAQKVPVTISEPVETRRSQVSAFGIKTLRPEDVAAGEYDNIVVAVNLPALVEEYVKGVADNGTVHVFAGLPAGTVLSLDAAAIHYRGVTVTGSSGFHLAAFHRAYEIIRADPAHFRRLITHRFPLDEATEAFETLAAGQAFKVLIRHESGRARQSVRRRSGRYQNRLRRDRFVPRRLRRDFRDAVRRRSRPRAAFLRRGGGGYVARLHAIVDALAAENPDFYLVAGGDGLAAYVAGRLLRTGHAHPRLLGVAMGTANVGPIISFSAADLKRTAPEKLSFLPCGAIEAFDGDVPVAFGFNDVVLGNTILGTIDGAARPISACAMAQDGSKVPAEPLSDIGESLVIRKNGVRSPSPLNHTAQIVVSAMERESLYGRAVTGMLCFTCWEIYARGAHSQRTPACRYGLRPARGLKPRRSPRRCSLARRMKSQSKDCRRRR
jgi:L-iditol 2-dehydrogenase